jgi:hypothetical protein
MGQQFFVLRKMPPVVPVLVTGADRAAAKEAPPAPTKGLRRTRKAEQPSQVDSITPRPKLRPERPAPPSNTPVSGATPARPAANRPPKKQNKGGKNRRGGRR